MTLVGKHTEVWDWQRILFNVNRDYAAEDSRSWREDPSLLCAAAQ